jgi:glycosyltransferase involved in cell wall biosynthesis
MRILFISDSFPYPPDSGVKVRDYNLIRRLADRCEVSLLAFAFNDMEEAGAQTMKQWCDTVEVVRYRRQGLRRHLPGAIKCLWKGRPLSCQFMYSSEFASKLRRITTAHHFDLIQIDCTPMAPYRECLSEQPQNGSAGTRTALVFIDVNAHKFQRLFEHEQRLSMRLRWWLDWQLMQRWEARYAGDFDMCVMMSDLDEQRVQHTNPRLNTAVIPNGVDVITKQLLPERRGSADLLLIGTLSHAPWADAVHYFHDRIFPLIKQVLPQARMVVVGSAPPSIQALAGDDIVITGYVPDVQPYYEQAAVSVVPLRSGGGTRLKILESLAYGRPVVTTTVGSEGLKLCPDRDLLVADDPLIFAQHTIRLLTEDTLRHSLAHQGRQTVERCYSWDVIADRLYTTYAQLCAA